ncbi:FAD-binding 8, partial [Cynara cardunculus var. scolymus]
MGDDAYKHILATLVAPYPFRHSFNLFRPTTRREYSNLHNPSRPYCNFGMYIPSPGKQVCPPSKQSKKISDVSPFLLMLASISKNTPMALWRRPAIVRGPLGIVTWTELLFLLMFMALLIWSISAYIHAMFATITTQSASRMGEKVWEVKLDSVGLMLGLAGNICLALLFFPVTRGSSVLRLIGLTSECSIKYHIWLGHTTMVFFTAHGLCYTIFWAKTNQIKQMVKWEKIGISNVAGEVALLTGIAIWSTTIPPLFLHASSLHSLCGILYTTCWIFLLLDHASWLLPLSHRSPPTIPAIPAKSSLSFSTRLHYNSMSSIFINIPSISKLQWHPFSITSSSNLDLEKLSVVVKSEGTWSQKLYEELSLPSPIDHLQVSVEGPYGPASTNFHQYDNLVMFSGGSGITPFISIIRELLYIANESSNSPQVLLIPAFKKSADLAMLDLLLPLSGTSHDLSRLQLQIQAYITQERGHTTEEQQFYRTIWFKPSALDAPISAILGRNCWLWLGVIIVCSSVIFLALIALLTQFYIYPIDHDTNMIYSYSVRSAFNMVLISMSIATTATIAFLWNKKRNSTEMRQIQMTDAPTPTTSPGMSSWSYNTDRELESLPSKTFIGSTKVNYGERPDFKRSSIGVLVSGPKKMRQDVAAICSSGLSKSFQFESISFS